MNVVIPLFLQGAHGLEPLGASIALAPGILLTVVMGPVAGRLFDRHGGRWSIPLGFLVMAVFVTLVGVAAGYTPIMLFAVLYVPAVLATAFVIGPSQTFALDSLDREAAPHGVTVVSTSFQIAGSVGTSLAAGLYGALTASNINAGRSEFNSMLTGFRGAVGFVVVTSLIGIVLAILAHRSIRAQHAADSAATEHDSSHAVESIIKSNVYALRSDPTVLDALQMFSERGISGAPIFSPDSSLAGFLSDGDVMRYLSATLPSSTSIHSYAIGADDDLEQAMADLATLNVMRLATHEVVTINADASIADAVATLSDAHLKKVPVLDSEDGNLVGIVSRSAINRLAIASCLSTREDALEMAGIQAV